MFFYSKPNPSELPKVLRDAVPTTMFIIVKIKQNKFGTTNGKKTDTITLAPHNDKRNKKRQQFMFGVERGKVKVGDFILECTCTNKTGLIESFKFLATPLDVFEFRKRVIGK